MKFQSGTTDFVMERQLSTKEDTAAFLTLMLTEAERHGRFTSGVYDCAQVLESNPEDVMLCILPSSPASDISVHIQHKLIEAYCWENDIQVLRVDSQDKLANLLNSSSHGATNKNRMLSEPQDFSCVLISHGQEEEEDSRLSDDDEWPDSVICLPG